MPLSDKEIYELETLLRIDEKDKHFSDAKQGFLSFAKYTKPENSYEGFIKVYFHVLELFAARQIKKLIITIPPQHTKSTASSELLPAYLFGKNPDLRIGIASYSAKHANNFNRKIQRIIDSRAYFNVFNNTTLAGSGFLQENPKNYIRTASEFEIVNHNGSLKSVGRGGPLTGSPIDVMLLDDLYKDYQEANSPIIRQSVWDWYTTVILTRLHNDSQQLIVFTRWHEEDLIGLLEQKETVITVANFSDLDNIPPDAWVKINFEAIKDSAPTEIDPRQKGEALFPLKHNINKLLKTRALDVENFNCLYQGNPVSKEGLLYGDFRTYFKLPTFKIIKNYTDTADTGKDYLCSMNYAVPLDPKDESCYITDIVYSNEAMEITEPLVVSLLANGRVNLADIESNNGGRGFARNVATGIKAIKKSGIKAVVSWFHQGGNKESRVFSNSASVNRKIVFPQDWATRWPDFYNHVTRFKKKFDANTFDDAPDCMTGIVERRDKGANRKIVW